MKTPLALKGITKIKASGMIRTIYLRREIIRLVRLLDRPSRPPQQVIEIAEIIKPIDIIFKAIDPNFIIFSLSLNKLSIWFGILKLKTVTPVLRSLHKKIVVINIY